MKRICMLLTEQLLEVIDEAKGEASRSSAVEDWLWRNSKIQAAARKLKCKRRPRRKQGRPIQGDEHDD